MNTTLFPLIADILGLDEEEINEESSSDNLEDWDSMAQVNLSAALEGEYGITLSTEHMAELTSVKAAKTILNQLGVSA